MTTPNIKEAFEFGFLWFVMIWGIYLIECIFYSIPAGIKNISNIGPPIEDFIFVSILFLIIFTILQYYWQLRKQRVTNHD